MEIVQREFSLSHPTEPDPTLSDFGNEDTRAFRFGWRAMLVNFSAWTVLALLSGANRAFAPRGAGFDIPTWTPFAAAFLDSYLWAIATPGIFWLAWRSGGDRKNWLGRALLLLGVGVVVAICMGAATQALGAELFGFGRFGPAQPLFTRIVFRAGLLVELITYAGVLATGFAWEYFLRYRARQEYAIRLQAHAATLQAQAAQLHAQLAEARLAVLRNQLNPHFLFNTLNAVSALVARDPKGVRRMISRLSDLLRYSLTGTAEPEVTVGKELELLQQYLEILEIRYQGRLETSIAIEGPISGALVPNLILQPLAENAMTHAIAKAGGFGRIEVRAYRHGDDLVLEVKDSGAGEIAESGIELFAPAKGTGVGLQITRERLRELYGDRQRFDLRPVIDGGMIAEVTLPYHTRPEARTLPTRASA